MLTGTGGSRAARTSEEGRTHLHERAQSLLGTLLPTPCSQQDHRLCQHLGVEIWALVKSRASLKENRISKMHCECIFTAAAELHAMHKLP